jgi:hypothetical protein
MHFCPIYISPPSGKAGELIDRGDNTYGGKYVINPSGGLISKGHPLGATGEEPSYSNIISTSNSVIYINFCDFKFKAIGHVR